MLQPAIFVSTCRNHLEVYSLPRNRLAPDWWVPWSIESRVRFELWSMPSITIKRILRRFFITCAVLVGLLALIVGAFIVYAGMDSESADYVRSRETHGAGILAF